ncbi:MULTISPECIES: response regulator [unclassified Butyrivibrio]|uniref:response regulator n=1 Tax=unclassified Butyrivibrio TaxID=2639466 RepID=UPI0003B49BB6|nr:MULTISPECIES: response regulator [unclassified Butyrivibrio]SEL00055.1 Response regulator receiver domain-containing protein [Butyrivibrio sp. ob235]
MGKEKMGKENVVILSSQETFSVHGMEMKLAEIGCVSKYIPIDMKKLQSNTESCELIVYYMDETVSDSASFLVYLKDLCMEKEKSLILIGKHEEYNEAIKTIPGRCITAWFERPLDMKAFLDTVSDVFSQRMLQQTRKVVLIVDDDVAYMQMIRDWLKDSYQVVMANTGIKAIRWLTVNKADLVLLDYQMPITTGPQIFEMLKSDTETDELPVMFLTGQKSRESVMTAMRLKPVDYILKSIGRDALRDKLDQYFAIQKAIAR